MRDINEKRRLEIEAWADEHGGVLPPEKLVEYARDESTACHSWFEWNDEQAAARHRVNQARSLLRILVTVVPNQQEAVRAFVSLQEDRTPAGGYRPIGDVLYDPAMRESLVKTALMEFRALQRRYKDLGELASVFAAIDHVERMTTDNTATEVRV